MGVIFWVLGVDFEPVEVDVGFLRVDFESLGIKFKHQEVDFRPLDGFESLRVNLWPNGVDLGLRVPEVRI